MYFYFYEHTIPKSCTFCTITIVLDYHDYDEVMCIQKIKPSYAHALVATPYENKLRKIIKILPFYILKVRKESNISKTISN